ncbi:hypothetical protein FIM02_01555 [SAR202 cluster bacterium AD-802-E10_MRT_200m]|nr:hypothetical protein [SAR202 cluster bacterium AD-802-E10_MRT_200m]
MKFAYNFVVAAPVNQVWKLLDDVPRAAQLMPGIESVKPHGQDTYEGTLRVRIGPMGFNLTGLIHVLTDRELGKWRITAQAEDPRIGGGVAADIGIEISEPSDTETAVYLNADVNFLGRLGQLGQPIIKKKSDAMVQEFIENLKQAILDSD